MSQFTKEQIAKLKDIAKLVVETKKWNELPWKDANSGNYPEKLTEEELETEYQRLFKLAIQIRDHGTGDVDYGDKCWATRMIGLEYSRTLNLFNLEPRDRSLNGHIMRDGKVIELEHTIDELGQMTCEELTEILKDGAIPL